MSAGRAAVLIAPGWTQVTSIEVGAPAAGQVRVAVGGCGVCGSNVPVWQGRPWFEYPLAPGAPGHEAWGRVEAVGDDVDGLQSGDAVALLADDAFVESIVVPATAAVALPASLDGALFPGEALGCAFNVAARAQFAPGQSVAVVGVGFLGAVVAALAKAAGAQVVAVSRRSFALDMARTMGADEVVSFTDDGAAVDQVRNATGGDLCDVVVEAVGAQASLDLAGELTDTGGRLVIAGFHQGGRRTVDLQLWNWRGIDVINAHERDPAVALGGIRRAADAIAVGTLDPTPLYTDVFPLDGLGDAMTAVVDRPDGFMKALVCP
jgi:threonine dehydrogenase-like Zn-dependent dehydrogenase